MGTDIGRGIAQDHVRDLKHLEWQCHCAVAAQRLEETGQQACAGHLRPPTAPVLARPRCLNWHVSRLAGAAVPVLSCRRGGACLKLGGLGVRNRDCGAVVGVVDQPKVFVERALPGMQSTAKSRGRAWLSRGAVRLIERRGSGRGLQGQTSAPPCSQRGRLRVGAGRTACSPGAVRRWCLWEGNAVGRGQSHRRSPHPPSRRTHARCLYDGATPEATESVRARIRGCDPCAGGGRGGVANTAACRRHANVEVGGVLDQASVQTHSGHQF